MNRKSHFKCLFVITVAGMSMLNSQALIFPQTSSTYDPNVNYLASWNNPMDFFGDRIGAFGGFCGTPISPHSFITAKHIAAGNQFSYRGVSYTITRAHYSQIYDDIVVYDVNGTFPDYAPLLRTPVVNGTKLRVYGCGWPPLDPAIVNNEVKGWTQNNQPQGGSPNVLRFGYARASTDAWGNISWKFSNNDSDPDLQQSCAAVSYGDSGGPIFYNNSLAGFLFQASAPGATITNTLPIAGCRSSVALFDVNGVTACNAQFGLTPMLASTITKSIYPHLAEILSFLSVRGASSGSAGPEWPQYSIPGTLYSTTAAIDLSGVLNPAPANVYKAVTVIPPSETEIFEANNLTPGSQYKVRVHFSSVPIQNFDYSKINFDVDVMDKYVQYIAHSFTPYSSGLNKGSVFEFPYTFYPDSSNKISVMIWPHDLYTSDNVAAISAIEVLLQ